MESSVQTRKRKVNYRRLSEGITLPREVFCKRYSITPKREVLPSTYKAVRIICTKSTSEVSFFCNIAMITVDIFVINFYFQFESDFLIG